MVRDPQGQVQAVSSFPVDVLQGLVMNVACCSLPSPPPSPPATWPSKVSLTPRFTGSVPEQTAATRQSSVALYTNAVWKLHVQHSRIAADRHLLRCQEVDGVELSKWPKLTSKAIRISKDKFLAPIVFSMHTHSIVCYWSIFSLCFFLFL